MFFVGEYLCLMFYYTFYRVLFESIPDWGTFFALEACHLFFEWICYPLRASDSLNRCITQNLQNSGCCGKKLIEFVCCVNVYGGLYMYMSVYLHYIEVVLTF